MGNPVFVSNSKVEIADTFNFKCTSCGEIFCLEDVKTTCPACKEVLFESMRKKEFTLLFIECMSIIGIARDKQLRFINKGNVPFKSLEICTKMSLMFDVNFQLKFGGNYKSFFIKETFDEIKANNFDHDKHRD